MVSVNPTLAQLQALIERGPEGPIVMVNLLKYRTKATYERTALLCCSAGTAS